MNQQGGRPIRHEDDHEDDWWRQLYDDPTPDTGPTAGADSLDDRFASAAGAVGAPPGADEPRPADRPADPRDAGQGEGPGAGTAPPGPPAEGTVPPQRAAAPPDGSPSQGAPWTSPPAAPPSPAVLPPGPRPPGFEPVRQAGEPPEYTGPPREESPAASLPPRPSAPPKPAVAPAAPEPEAVHPVTHLDLPALPPPPAGVDYVGSGPPTYDPEPTALPAADPEGLDELVADTVLDGARYGACTLRAASVRGDSARFRGEPRRDSLLTARFGSGEQALVLVAMATGARATPDAHRVAAEACQWIGRAVGRSHARLVEDIRAGRRGELKSGLHRLTDRSLGQLRASATEQGVDPEEYAATLRCLLLPAHPDCRTRVFFGVGAGGLFRLRGGEWQDIEPRVSAASAAGEPVVGFGSLPAETPEGDRLTMDFGIPTPPSPFEPAPEPPREPFRFRTSIARPGDALLMCTAGLADPLRGEAALCAYLARRWSGRTAPGLAAFLGDTQVRVKGYADDRTVAAVWEA
ncbi:protein phosphatase 2C domain-containing protein [Streptomyces sp. NPDC046915]|uniref:protein phosphatase 2C domain-containing protein n=1 Tax=Streptomyces sp. NPDC046915 TaxID=3155257 RepID=UPI0033FB1D3B